MDFNYLGFLMVGGAVLLASTNLRTRGPLMIPFALVGLAMAVKPFF